MKIVFNERAWEEYIYWVNEDKHIVKKINELIKDIIKNICFLIIILIYLSNCLRFYHYKVCINILYCYPLYKINLHV